MAMRADTDKYVDGPCPAVLQELMSFLSTTTSTQLVVDRSPQNELLKLNFNIRSVAGQPPWCGPGTSVLNLVHAALTHLPPYPVHIHLCQLPCAFV